MLAGTATALSARAYSRVMGANDRIRLAQLGCGGRSQGHVHMVHMASQRTPVEVVAVCDIWTFARERRAAQVKDVFGTAPETFKYSEEMLAKPDIDGVMIATGDHQHAKLCIEVVQAGKDCYVEKPFANVLAEAKAARAAVKASKQVVQMGTQHRSQPYPLAVRDIIQSGRIGDVVRITQEWNVNQPRWRHIPRIDDGTHPTATQGRGHGLATLVARKAVSALSIRTCISNSACIGTSLRASSINGSVMARILSTFGRTKHTLSVRRRRAASSRGKTGGRIRTMSRSHSRIRRASFTRIRRRFQIATGATAAYKAGTAQSKITEAKALLYSW